MKKNYIYGIAFIIVALFSCNEEPVKPRVIDEKEGLDVKVAYEAGTKWAEQDNFLPLPFNIATSNGEDIIVLSNRIKRGQTLKVKPIGAIRLTQNDSLKTYVVSIPTSNKFKTFVSTDFDEFSTVHSGAKWIVEQYLTNRSKPNVVRLKSWENESFAIKYLLK